MADIIFDIAQVLWRLVFILFCYLNSINSGGWMASMASPTTALVFLGGLGLRLISRRRGLGLSLVLVFEGLIEGLLIGVFFVFFCQRTMTFQVSRINFPNIEEWL